MIALVGFICLFLYVFLRIYTLFIFNKERRRSAVARIRGKLLRWSMATLGATFIKLGQVLSSRPDLLPAEMIEELRKLQDNVPAFSFRRARKIIEAEMGAPIADTFESFDRKPVAAASVAQVHRAVLKNGTEVAVKVLRPNVRRQVTRDGRLLLLLAKIMTISRKARLSDPVGHLEHFVEGIVEQTDLRKEARHYELFHENFANQDDVLFPEIFVDYSGERVLTMAFIRGRKIDEIDPTEFPTLGKTTRRVFFQMCYQDGFVHADLHPGNMLITPDGKLAIFDAGLVKHLVDDLLIQLVDFSRCVAMGDTKDFVNHLKRFHHYMEGTDWDEIEKDSEGFVAQFRDQNTADLEMGKFINEVFAIARKHHIRPLPDMTLVLVGVVTSEGISKLLDPDVNTFHEMAVFLMPVIAKLGLDKEPFERWLSHVDIILADEHKRSEEAAAGGLV